MKNQHGLARREVTRDEGGHGLRQGPTNGAPHGAVNRIARGASIEGLQRSQLQQRLTRIGQVATQSQVRGQAASLTRASLKVEFQSLHGRNLRQQKAPGESSPGASSR